MWTKTVEFLLPPDIALYSMFTCWAHPFTTPHHSTRHIRDCQRDNISAFNTVCSLLGKHLWTIFASTESLHTLFDLCSHVAERQTKHLLVWLYVLSHWLIIGAEWNCCVHCTTSSSLLTRRKQLLSIERSDVCRREEMRTGFSSAEVEEW